MNLAEELGLRADFCATAFNSNFKRSNDWLPSRQKDVDYWGPFSIAACCWITAGHLAVIAARLETLAASHIAEALVVRDQLLDLAGASDAAPEFPARIAEDAVERDADFALIRAINLAIDVGRTALRGPPSNNLDYLVEGLHVGVLWVLWGEQAVYDFKPWRTHARRVIVASDKRTDAPKSARGNLIPRHLLAMGQPANKAAFARSGTK